MTQFNNKTFSVPTGGRNAKDCIKAWPGTEMAQGKCVICKEQVCAECKGFSNHINYQADGSGEHFVCQACDGKGHEWQRVEKNGNS